MRSLGASRSRPHTGRRALALLAAVAVPAFAAPESWTDFATGAPVDATAEVPKAMPFENAGSSFPGSAFYYLTQDNAVPAFGEGIHSDAQDAPPQTGPAARAMRVDASGVDRTRALQCLTAAIYYEAASEPDAGQRAVAQVVLNRIAHPSYPKTVCGVVYQGSERSTGCQFSFTCDGALARVPNRLFWQRALDVAQAALAGYVYAPAGLATHYHTIQIHPYWADSLSYIGTIGAHRFYRFGGRAGQPATFRFAYLGGEPVAGPHARDAATDRAPDPVLDPAAVQRAWELAPATATPAAARAAPVPTYSQELQSRGGDALYRAERLPEATGIRPEYANSGAWIVQPGS